jgi:hypothetical protein
MRRLYRQGMFDLQPSTVLKLYSFQYLDTAATYPAIMHTRLQILIGDGLPEEAFLLKLLSRLREGFRSNYAPFEDCLTDSYEHPISIGGPVYHPEYDEDRFSVFSLDGSEEPEDLGKTGYL